MRRSCYTVLVYPVFLGLMSALGIFARNRIHLSYCHKIGRMWQSKRRNSVSNRDISPEIILTKRGGELCDEDERTKLNPRVVPTQFRLAGRKFELHYL
ncbi:hypothetical protein BDN72DRAFT_340403 [Pluteus cervinus]|uniref:Uncharacterized protein n=1 Tax=Pluteus cervinus TaxID=181527 RepID=A0ACD3ABS2_9AGAR|nr:hypothetical protein BDN72DRAFT_340403 [Pluteus cervinus]